MNKRTSLNHRLSFDFFWMSTNMSAPLTSAPTCRSILIALMPFVAAIRDDEVFHNNSNNSQMLVEEQVAITLYRFGHHGNSASTM
ncbi:hypothetical protein C8R44DRAFT_816674, partial [Mycena epipterygia]